MLKETSPSSSILEGRPDVFNQAPRHLACRSCNINVSQWKKRATLPLHSLPTSKIHEGMIISNDHNDLRYLRSQTQACFTETVFH
jgi:hypothetical protein